MESWGRRLSVHIYLQDKYNHFKTLETWSEGDWWNSLGILVFTVLTCDVGWNRDITRKIKQMRKGDVCPRHTQDLSVYCYPKKITMSKLNLRDHHSCKICERRNCFGLFFTKAGPGEMYYLESIYMCFPLNPAFAIHGLFNVSRSAMYPVVNEKDQIWWWYVSLIVSAQSCSYRTGIRRPKGMLSWCPLDNLYTGGLRFPRFQAGVILREREDWGRTTKSVCWIYNNPFM